MVKFAVSHIFQFVICAKQLKEENYYYYYYYSTMISALQVIFIKFRASSCPLGDLQKYKKIYTINIFLFSSLVPISDETMVTFAFQCFQKLC
jgi:hypothetical protein